MLAYSDSPSHSSPALRAKAFPLGHVRLDCCALDIHGGRHDIVPPPARRLDAVQCKSEEDEERSQGEAEVERR